MTREARVQALELKDIPSDLQTPSKWFTQPKSETLKMFEESPSLANVQRVLANNPALMKRWMGFAHYLLNETTLELRDRELTILRISVLGGYDYEWGQHVRIAQNACDFKDADFEKVLAGSSHDGWSDRERSLIVMVEELMTNRAVSTEAWENGLKHYTLVQMMDVVFVVGNYNMLGMAINSFDVELDDGLQPIPVY